jgi:hypothetical protein
MSNLPNWIEALAALSIVALTYRTLVVLKGYAADTKTIAKASSSQIENAQMPFLVVAPTQSGWAIENQGFGPSINATWTYREAGTKATMVVCQIPALAPKEFHNVQNEFSQLIGNSEVSIDYESLSGLKYQTLITWTEGSQIVKFDRR